MFQSSQITERQTPILNGNKSISFLMNTNETPVNPPLSQVFEYVCYDEQNTNLVRRGPSSSRAFRHYVCLFRLTGNECVYDTFIS